MPNGIFVDESSVAYNAYCIERTGADEHGIGYPVFFLCFGNYQDPVMVYTVAAFINVFGFEKWVVRFPSGLYHVLAAVSFFFLAVKFMRNKLICIAGAFVFSVIPWLFPLSRTGIGGYLPMVLGIIAGCYFLFEAFGKRSFPAAVLAGISWAFTMYAHQIGRPMAAVILICFVLSMNYLLLRRWRVFAVFVSTYVLLMIPMILYVVSNPRSMTDRFNAISLFKDSTVTNAVSGLFQRYFEYFGFNFLFFTGDEILRHNIGTGELFIFMFPLLLAGGYVLIRYFKRNPIYRFILLCVLTYPLAASLTANHYHCTRCMNGVPFLCIAALIGMKYIYARRKRFGILLAVILAIAAYEIPSYMTRYFGAYQVDSRSSFNATQVEAVGRALKFLGGNETLYISRFIFFPEEIQPQFKPEFYTNILFLAKIDPLLYQRGGLPPEKVRLYEGNFDRPGVLLTLDSLYLMDENGNVRITKDFEKRPGNLNLIEKIPVPSGINIEIYRVY
ncbi:MAG: glycosyltransferase family 39 protein [Victivallales bacterium]